MGKVSICPVCEEEFYAQYRNKKYCSEACKQKMYRIRLEKRNENFAYPGIRNKDTEDTSASYIPLNEVAKFAIEISKSWAAEILEYAQEDCYQYDDFKLLHFRVGELKTLLHSKYFPKSAILFAFFNFVDRLFKTLKDYKKEMDENGWIYIRLKSSDFKPCKKMLDME